MNQEGLLGTRTANPTYNGQLQKLPPAPDNDDEDGVSILQRDPPVVEITPPNWREFELPEVPLPNDSEYEAQLLQRFDLTNLLQQISTKQ